MVRDPRTSKEEERFRSFSQIGSVIYHRIITGQVACGPSYDPTAGDYRIVLYKMLDPEESGPEFFSPTRGVREEEVQVVATLKIDQVALAKTRELVPWESVADLLSATRNN